MRSRNSNIDLAPRLFSARRPRALRPLLWLRALASVRRLLPKSGGYQVDDGLVAPTTSAEASVSRASGVSPPGPKHASLES